MRKSYSFALVFAVSVYFLFLIKAMFVPGMLLNGEQTIYSSLAACFKESSMWFFPGAWCPYLPQFSSIYVITSPVFNAFVLFLSFVFSVDAAYKLGVVLCWFFVPFVLFFLFSRAQKYWAAVVAFVVLLFMEGARYFGFNYVLYTGPHHAIAWGLLVLNSVIAVDFLEKPELKRLVLFAVLTASLLLVHFAIFLIFVLMLFVFVLASGKKYLAAFYGEHSVNEQSVADEVRKASQPIWKPFVMRAGSKGERIARFSPKPFVLANIKQIKLWWKHFVLYSLLVFLLAGFWLVPFVFKGFFFRERGEFVGYGLSLGSVFDMFVELFKTTPVLISILGVVGIILFVRGKDKAGQLLRASLAAIFFVVLISPVEQLNTFFQAVRLPHLFVILLSAGVGLFFEWCVSQLICQEKNKIVFWSECFALLLIAGFIFVPQITDFAHSAEFIVAGEDSRFGFRPAEMYSKVVPFINESKGRLLVAETYSVDILSGQSLSLHEEVLSRTRFWLPLALLSKTELVSVDHSIREGNSSAGSVLVLSPVTWYTRFTKTDFYASKAKDLSVPLDVLNVEFILVPDPLHKLYAPLARPVMEVVFGESEAESLRFFLLRRNASLSFFSFESGKSSVVSESYNHTVAEIVVDAIVPVSVVFRQMAWPNWKVFVDGVEAKWEMNDVGFMLVNVPPGKHKVRFFYSMLWYEYLGSVLSVIGVVLVFLLWLHLRMR